MRKKPSWMISANLVEQAPLLVKEFGKWPAFAYLLVATLCRPLLACIFLLITLLTKTLP